MTPRRRWTIDELRSELSSLGEGEELVDLATRLGDLRRQADAPSTLESIWDAITRRSADQADDPDSSDSENASGK